MGTTETCGPPFLRPVRQCVDAPREVGAAAAMRGLGNGLGLFDRQCECDTVTDFQEGYDKESCGCQG